MKLPCSRPLFCVQELLRLLMQASVQSSANCKLLMQVHLSNCSALPNKFFPYLCDARGMPAGGAAELAQDAGTAYQGGSPNLRWVACHDSTKVAAWTTLMLKSSKLHA